MITYTNENEVRRTAHQIWENEGRPEGREKEHWFRAEEEMKNPLGYKVKEVCGPTQYERNKPKWSLSWDWYVIPCEFDMMRISKACGENVVKVTLNDLSAIPMFAPICFLAKITSSWLENRRTNRAMLCGYQEGYYTERWELLDAEITDVEFPGIGPKAHKVVVTIKFRDVNKLPMDGSLPAYNKPFTPPPI